MSPRGQRSGSGGKNQRGQVPVWFLALGATLAVAQALDLASYTNRAMAARPARPT